MGKRMQNSCTVVCKVGILTKVSAHSNTHFDVASQLVLSMLSVLVKKYGNIPKNYVLCGTASVGINRRNPRYRSGGNLFWLQGLIFVHYCTLSLSLSLYIYIYLDKHTFIHSFIHSLVFSLIGRAGRNQSPVM